MMDNQIVMSLDTFLAKRSLSSPISGYMLDKCRFPNGMTLRQRQKLEDDCLRYNQEYSRKRREAIEEYNSLVESGQIRPQTRTERLIEIAKYGHLDNDLTHAAIRVLNKRGITITRTE